MDNYPGLYRKSEYGFYLAKNHTILADQASLLLPPSLILLIAGSSPVSTWNKQLLEPTNFPFLDPVKQLQILFYLYKALFCGFR